MKTIHLLCNAHLDPVWLWQWKEGAAEAVSTFRVAAEFCEAYDGFVFNHNEALLYEWVEEYEPALFQRIQKLVEQGRWVIMGGWYLQPDCVLTSGESLLTQIRLGREYFQRKFNKIPTTAINFDPFGHTRGLVQILKKTGYDGYIFMRPQEIKDDFIWEGFDGSRILAHGIFGGYNTLKGKGADKIEQLIAEKNPELGLCLWGIGNHGGGPSKIDLEKIDAMIENQKDFHILHSSAEKYIHAIKQEELPVRKESLIPCMVGCYTSMVRIKQANRRLENKLAVAEKIMSYAELNGIRVFDESKWTEAQKALAFCQFHDILPGSAIKSVEEDSLRRFAYGEEIADRFFAKAFFALCSGQKKAKDKEIPIMLFNPHPYEIETEFEVEFMLEDQNWNLGEKTMAVVYDADKNFLPSQNEKPECTFNLDWIQKVVFRARIAPSSVSRFNCKLSIEKDFCREVPKIADDCFIWQEEQKEVRISKKTGLLSLYKIGEEVLVHDSGKIEVYDDNEDPWGMTVDSFQKKIGEFALMSDKEAAEFLGYPEETGGNVRIVENGAVRTKVQAFFKYKSSVAVMEYTIPKKSAYIEVDLILYFHEANKMVKYRLDTCLKNSKAYGQTAFGSEKLFSDGREAVFHQWCALEGKNGRLGIVNEGIYGGSFEENTLWLSLLRTPLYSAHPIEKRPIAPRDRFIKHMDMGERCFHFRITPEKNIEREAQIFNEKPFALSFFPDGMGVSPLEALRIDCACVLLTSLKKHRNGYIAHLFNTSAQECAAEITVPPFRLQEQLRFKSFELKFVFIGQDGIQETEEF